MRTAQQREDDFRREFQELLEKHGAEIDIDVDFSQYTFGSSPRPVVNVTMTSVWNTETNCFDADFAHFEL